MKILVTGANGYLGQGVVKQLIEDNMSVIATDIVGTNIDKRAIIKEADIFGIDNPYEYFGEPDVLLHMAWREGFIHNSINHINDLPKHFSFIKKMVESGVKQVAVMGSMHEIGFFEGSINENTECNPQCLYGIAKDSLRRCVELLASENGIIYQWLRGYYIVGNSKFGSSIFSKITAAEEEKKTEFPFTMGQNQCDFLEYDEFCVQVAATVEQTAVTGIINICSGRPEKLADRVEKFIRDNNYSIKLKYGVFPERKYDSKAIWGDSNKIERIMKQR